MPNGQIFGGPRDGDWIAAKTETLVLVERVGDVNQVVTYIIDTNYRWIEVNRRDVKNQ
jgi:hypothetical protein